MAYTVSPTEANEIASEVLRLAEDAKERGGVRRVDASEQRAQHASEVPVTDPQKEHESYMARVRARMIAVRDGVPFVEPAATSAAPTLSDRTYASA